MKRAPLIFWLIPLCLSALTARAVTVTNIAAGEYHSLLLKSDGSFWGMGYNGDGELGDGTSSNRYTPEEIVSGNVVAIAAGDSHSLFVKSDGSLWGMGYDGDGALGDGTNVSRYLPEEIVSSNVVAIAASWRHSLFLKSDGSLWGMGYNQDGELGDGTTNNRYAPEEIVSNGVVAISSRYKHSLFLKSNGSGSLWGMGYNGVGQLGITNTVNQTNPVEIVSSGVAAIAAGESYSLFLKSDGSLWGMGRNGDGQLGLTNAISQTNSPAELVASNVTAIATGFYQSLFLKSDGSLWAMGDDYDGELGDGTGVHSSYVYFPERINAITFSANPVTGFAPLAVQFTSPGADFYGNPLTSWNWNFGDSSNNVVQNPSHTYQTIGNYSPALLATNNLGVPVIGAGPQITVPFNGGLVVNGGFETGSFSGWTQSGNTSFSSVVSPGQVTYPADYIHSGNYGCRMGPGTLGYLNQTLPTTPGASYLVSCWLNATNAFGQYQFTAAWNGVTVLNLTNPPAPEAGWVNFQFVAAATSASTALQFGFEAQNYLGFDDVTVFPVSSVAAVVDKTNGPFPLTVHFTSPGTDNSGHAITNWNWNFGDGTTNSPVQDPIHTYFQIGTFSPILVGLNNTNGLVGWGGPAIAVTTPTLQFTASPTNGPAPFTVQCTSPVADSGGSAITSWNWNFGDGTTSTTQNPSHAYIVQGTFPLTLQATNSYGMQVNAIGPAAIQLSGLVNNFSFENLNPTNASLPAGWTIGDTNGNNTAAQIVSDQTHSGTNSLYFSYNTMASQNLSTVPGVGYLVSFWIYRGNYAGQPDGNFAASWNGSTIFFQTTNGVQEFVWTNVQCYVVATGTNALLQFQTWPTPYCDIYLDDVSVTPAEVEPATATPSNGPINLTVQFNAPATDTYGNTITNWNWDFGDGSPQISAQNPSHTYTGVGLYFPVLVATNNHGTAVPGATVAVTTSLPTVQVAANPTNGTAPLAVQFTTPATDNSGLTITNWNWTFGDSVSGAGQNPLHTYYGDSGNPSSYPPFQPALIATNSAGIEVIGIVPPITVTYNEGLVANGGFESGLTGWTANGVQNWSFGYSGGSSAYFDFVGGSLAQTIATTPGAGYVLSYAAQAGAGMNDLEVFWNGQPLLVGTNWNAGANWTNFLFFVTANDTNSMLEFLYATNAAGAQLLDDVSLFPVEIEPFTATPVSGPIPLTVQFTAPATDTASNAIAHWDWDFGDGSPHSSAQKPLHTYTTAGNFVPVLTATVAGGAQVPAQSGPVIATTYPMIIFTATPTNGINPLNVQFTSPNVDSSGQIVTNWNWNFGDGGVSTTQNPSHTYYSAGTFSPALLATNTLGAPVLGTGPAISVAFSSGIVSNGGFETGTFAGWTAQAGSISTAAAYVHSGTYGAQLGPTSLSFLSQTLTTTPGSAYTLSFWLNGSGTPNEFLVNWNGTTLMNLTNVSLSGWTNFQFAVNATAASTVLQFGYFNGPSYFGLDDISVLPTAVGAPVLTIGGLSGSQFKISWPVTANVELQTASNLAPPIVWLPVTNGVVTNAGVNSVVVTNLPGSGNRFYRLAPP